MHLYGFLFLLAHAVLGASVAAAGGDSAMVGALAATGAEASAPRIAQWLYGKEIKDLTLEEKSTVSSIAGLAGAGIGGTVGSTVNNTVIGSQLGQNSVDNNWGGRLGRLWYQMGKSGYLKQRVFMRIIWQMV